jgi:hypothetical protein
MLKRVGTMQSRENLLRVVAASVQEGLDVVVGIFALEAVIEGRLIA